VVFFLPQLVQLLRGDDGAIGSFFLTSARHSDLFAHNLMWALASESRPPEEAFNPEVKRWVAVRHWTRSTRSCDVLFSVCRSSSACCCMRCGRVIGPWRHGLACSALVILPQIQGMAL
jgi:hypothetical protein